MIGQTKKSSVIPNSESLCTGFGESLFPAGADFLTPTRPQGHSLALVFTSGPSTSEPLFLQGCLGRAEFGDSQRSRSGAMRPHETPKKSRWEGAARKGAGQAGSLPLGTACAHFPAQGRDGSPSSHPKQAQAVCREFLCSHGNSDTCPVYALETWQKKAPELCQGKGREGVSVHSQGHRPMGQCHGSGPRRGRHLRWQHAASCCQRGPGHGGGGRGSVPRLSEQLAKGPGLGETSGFGCACAFLEGMRRSVAC